MRRPWTPRLLLLSGAHLTIDAYSSFLSPLLPLIVAKLGLSLGSVGTLVALSSVTGSLSQPLFGLAADRVRRPWFVVFGPLVAALFMSASGGASGFAQLATLVMIAGLGVAAFHPQAAVLAAQSSDQRSFAMSVFVTGGTLGFSLGPLIAALIATRLGLERTWVASLPGIAVTAVLVAWFARLKPEPRAREAPPRFAELRPVARPLTLIYLCNVFRTVVSFGFITFIPLLLHGEGYSVSAAGGVLAAFLAAGGIGGFVGGWFSQRWGGRRVLLASFALALPLYMVFLLARGPIPLVCLMLAQFALQLSLPVNVVMGQELSPRHASTVSSLLMGFAWGMGQLMVAPFGALADHWGLRPALFALSGFSLLGLACARWLPEQQVGAEPAVTV